MPEIPVPDPPLRDDEIALRPWLAEDVPQVAAHCQDPEIARWTQVPSPYGEEQARDFVGGAEARRLAGGELALAIVRRDDDRVCGAVALQPGGEEGRAELGYWVAADSRRRGIAARAVRLLASWALDSLGIQRLEIMAHPDNEASQRVALRAGFRREGLMRAYRERKGQREDRVVFALPGRSSVWDH